MRERFWERHPLEELTGEEWESLCDGCGRCCLVKLHDEDTNELHFTSLACNFLDICHSRCTVYNERFRRQPDCIRVTPSLAREHADWLPDTCAYRLVAEGKPLKDWHPLISGTPDSVIDAGISVAGRVIHEKDVPEEDQQDYLWDLE